MAKQDLVLGEDGIYRSVSSHPTDASTIQAAVVCPDAATPAAADARRLHLKTSISSSISGPGIGENVADKKAALLGAQGEPQVGRRQTPDVDSPTSGQRLYVVGLILAVVVLAIVITIIYLLADSLQL